MKNAEHLSVFSAPSSIQVTLASIFWSLIRNQKESWLFRATPVAYGGYQAKGQIRAVAAGLCHSHSSVGSKPPVQPTPQLTAVSDS